MRATALGAALIITTGLARAAAAAPTLNEVLAAQPPPVVELNGEESERWALTTLLRHDFAHTPTLRRQVRERMQQPLWLMRNPTWLDELERRAALARLHPIEHAVTQTSAVAFDIPLADHPLVDLYIDYFTGRGRWYFAKWLARLDRFAPVMRPILAAHGLPEDLVYLALIESGMSANAVSRAGASGFWQFMPDTARKNAMRIDVWVDERRDFVRSTEAAALYLRALYSEFGGDWFLAWSAYNAGSGRIHRTLDQSGVNDFWRLIAMQRLPKETRHYAPKLIAAAIIAKDRARYGFADLEALEPLAYDEVELFLPMDLRLVAKHLAVPYQALRELNPGLLQDVTPPKDRYLLRVPKGRGAETTAWVATLPADSRVAYRHYTVRRGDSLYVIAQRYRSTVTAIREFNDVRDVRSLNPGRVLIIPAVREPVRLLERPPPVPAAASAAAHPKPAGKPIASHVVVDGETLWSIGRRYGVSVDDLKSWNRRVSNVISAGETLTIFAGAEVASR